MVMVVEMVVGVSCWWGRGRRDELEVHKDVEAVEVMSRVLLVLMIRYGSITPAEAVRSYVKYSISC